MIALTFICITDFTPISSTVLGEVSSYHSLLVNQYPKVSIVDPATNEVIEKRKSDVPTQIVFDAIMKSGVIFTYKLHTSANFTAGAKPRTDRGRLPGLDWRIFGSKGEIRVTGYKMWSLNAGADDIVLEICKVDDGEVVTVDIDVDEFEHLPIPARNIARLYEAFASGAGIQQKKGEWYPDFDYALKKHELIEEMYLKNGF